MERINLSNGSYIFTSGYGGTHYPKMCREVQDSLNSHGEYLGVNPNANKYMDGAFLRVVKEKVAEANENAYRILDEIAYGK